MISFLNLLSRWHDKHLMARAAKNLNYALQARARESTADFIMKNFGSGVKVCRSKQELWDFALSLAKLNTGFAAEFGVYKAHSTNYLARKLNGKTLFAFDSFEGLPETWRINYKLGKFKLDTIPKVEANVKLEIGWFEDTLPRAKSRYNLSSASLIHLDADLYSSTKFVLMELSSAIKSGCILVFDEYFNYPGWENGEFKAFAEFVSRYKVKYEYMAYNCYHEQVIVRIK